MDLARIIRTIGNSFHRPARHQWKPNAMASINPLGLALLKEFEGLKLRAYLDSGNVWTCGYGHISGVGPHTTCTEELADKWLTQDLEVTESLVSHLVTVPLSSNQFSALVCFTFNEGAGHLKESTLLEKINVRDFEGAANAILLWDKCRGNVIQGLIRRRQAERALFLA